MKQIDRQVIEVAQFNELPAMKLQIRKTILDHVTEDLALEVQGMSIEECKDAMDYLINKTKELGNTN